MKRLKELDSLRGLAALSVLFLHYTLSYGTEIGWIAGKPLVVFSLARTGVAIFFVISGFVIYHSLQRAETLRDFAVARFARLYPAYYTCMALTGVIVFVAGFNFRHVHYADALVI
jgi:peptidoglycan/LPS O-acetylase OafA/YrhL